MNKLLPLAFLAAALVLLATPTTAQTLLGDHGGSDSVVVTSTNWNTHVYQIAAIRTQALLTIKNISADADLGVAQDADTTATGTFGPFNRIGPGETLPLPINCKLLRLKSLKTGSNSAARMNVSR